MTSYPIGSNSLINFRKNSENIYESPGDDDKSPNAGSP